MNTTSLWYKDPSKLVGIATTVVGAVIAGFAYVATEAPEIAWTGPVLIALNAISIMLVRLRAWSPKSVDKIIELAKSGVAVSSETTLP